MKVTFDKVIDILSEEYEKTLWQEHAKKPLSKALYETWKIVYKNEKDREQNEII